MLREQVFLSGGAFMESCKGVWASKYRMNFNGTSGGTYNLFHEIRMSYGSPEQMVEYRTYPW